MNWFRLIAFTLAWATIFIVWIRSDRRARWVSLALFTVPGIGLLCFWAAYRGRFGEFWAGLVIGLALTVVWWFIWGGRMPPADSNNIKVWGQE